MSNQRAIIPRPERGLKRRDGAAWPLQRIVPLAAVALALSWGAGRWMLARRGRQLQQDDPIPAHPRVYRVIHYRIVRIRLRPPVEPRLRRSGL